MTKADGLPDWNPLVMALQGPDDDPLGVRMLRGFLGPSRDDGWVVLFEDPELVGGVQVQLKAIRLHRRFPQGDSSPLEIDALWVDSDTEVRSWQRQNAVERPGGNGPGTADTYRPRRW